MQYQKVERAHIVPRAYLRGFADDDERIALRMVEGGDQVVTSINNAAVRKAFYRRTRPDGTPIDDIEWAMSRLESHVAPLLRELEDRWPLAYGDKAILAEFAALQLVRSPRWRAWHDQFVDKTVDEWRRGEGLPESAVEASDDELHRWIERAANQIRGDTQRHVKMLALLGKLASILGSMNWTLLRFERPLVATSDHPVHLWPIERRASRPELGRLNAGILPTLEVRLPVSAHAALLMTCIPEPDPPAHVAGKRQHLRNLNAFTIAEAERQWFHCPRVSPPTIDGILAPLSSQLYAGYDGRAAWQSPLRQEVSRRIQPRIGEELRPNDQIEIVRVNSRARH